MPLVDDIGSRRDRQDSPGDRSRFQGQGPLPRWSLFYRAGVVGVGGSPPAYPGQRAGIPLLQPGRPSPTNRECLPLTRAVWDTAIALDHLGIVAQAQGDYGGAIELLTESEALFAELGERFSQGRALNHLGEVSILQGALAAAREYYGKGLRLAREAGTTPVLLDVLSGLARLEAGAGREGNALAIHTPLQENDLERVIEELLNAP